MKRLLSSIGLLLAGLAIGYLYCEFKRPPYPRDWDRIHIGMNLEDCMKQLPGSKLSSIGQIDKDESPTYWSKQGLGPRHWDLVIVCDHNSKVVSIERSFRDDRLGLTSVSMSTGNAPSSR